MPNFRESIKLGRLNLMRTRARVKWPYQRQREQEQQATDGAIHVPDDCPCPICTARLSGAGGFVLQLVRNEEPDDDSPAPDAPKAH